MTSLRQYVTHLINLPVGAGHCYFVALHNLSNGKCFIQAPPLSIQITPEEIITIKRGFDSPDSLYSTGITLRGVRFIYLTTVDNVMFGKKRDIGCIAMECRKSDSVLIVIHSCKEATYDILMEMKLVIQNCEDFPIY